MNGEYTFFFSIIVISLDTCASLWAGLEVNFGIKKEEYVVLLRFCSNIEKNKI